MKKLLRTGLWIGAISLALTLLLTSCGQISQLVPKTNTGNPNQSILPATNVPVPVTGGKPTVVTSDQTTDGTSVVVTKVFSIGPGWIAIHNQENGNIGPVIGVTHLNDGENDNVTVKIDPSKATPTLYAMLHTDGGVIGTYEFPGPDIPVSVNGQMVSPSFITSKGAANVRTSSITAHDQDVSAGKVMIDDVVSNSPGWIDLHALNPDGTPGNEVGFTAVHAGDNKNVVVTIDASKATEEMNAMLHIDAGTIGVFENPGPDTPVTINGQKVSTTFKTRITGAVAQVSGTQAATPAATVPTMDMSQTAAATQASTAVPNLGMGNVTPSGGPSPVVKVSDQDVNNGTVKVDDVVSSGPGWIVIYTVNNGATDQIIGMTHVNDGDNQNVTVQVDQSKVTDKLYAQLQVDAGKVGTFEFPGPDVPVMFGVQMISGMFNSKVVVNTPTQPPDLTPAITITDLPVHNGAIIIPQVISNVDAWVAIHPQNPDGSMGDFIGARAVPAGVTKNVVVHIDTSQATRTMYAMLHINASKAATPQFPGVDEPIMVNGKMLMPQFNVTGSLAGDVPLSVGKNSAGVNILTDSLGMSLYLSLNDQPGKSNCTGDCLTTWHPLLATGVVNAGEGVSVDKLGILILPNRTHQVTYAGSPLYYYTGDQNPGDTKGQGLQGSWFLVTP